MLRTLTQSTKALVAVAVLAATMLLAAGPAPAASPASTDLFAAVSPDQEIDLPDDPTILRSRIVRVNLDRLPEPGEGGAVRLNFFPDVTLAADLKHVAGASPGADAWRGPIPDVPLGQVALVRKNGVLAGNATMPGAAYQIRPLGADLYAVHEIDQSAFPPELEPIPVSLSEEALAEAAQTPLVDDGSIIDVLVVYTPASRTAVGGTAAMEALIDLAVTETNGSYANSNVTQRVSLVHTAEVSYVESGFSTDLNRVTNPSDGYMDNVHTLRDTYAADEVVLLINDSSYCGLAWMMTTVSTAFEDHAFATVYHGCATGYYSFGHEMGHNMGAHHDWYVNSTTAPYAYNHGYVNFPDRWRTVMAYNTECSVRGDNCTRLQYWSNPNVTYGGDPMGVPAGTSTSCSEGVINPNCDADNHLLLNNTAYTVANFRTSAPPPVGPLAYDGHTIDDDNSGDSSGNGNGIVDCGETIEMYVNLLNQGSAAAENISARVTSSDPYIAIIYNFASPYADISGGGSGTNLDDYDVWVNASAPNGHTIHFDLEITASNGGPWYDSFDVPVSCPVVYDHEDYLPIVSKNLVSSSNFGLPISESFESGLVPPPDWTLVQTNPRQTWGPRTGSAPGAGSYSATCHYDDQLSPQDEILLSPAFQASSAQLQFQSSGSVYWCRDTYDNCDLNVWLVVGDWGGGDDIYVHTADNDWLVSYEWALSTVDLTPHLPSGPVRIGFQYVGTDGAQVSLDGISITE